jgi:hypothetical protein
MNILNIFSQVCFSMKSIDIYIIAMNISHMTVNSLEVQYCYIMNLIN